MPNTLQSSNNPDLITLNIHDLYVVITRIRDIGLGIEGVSSLLAESLTNSIQTKPYHIESSQLITLLTDYLQVELEDVLQLVSKQTKQGGSVC